jgi:hypothetical protein
VDRGRFRTRAQRKGQDGDGEKRGRTGHGYVSNSCKI